MSRRDDSLSLRQMADYIGEAMEIAKTLRRSDLEHDRVHLLALLKLVEMTGEAAARISEPLRLAHPEIPWREIVGTRHHLVHGYDAVDYDILWNIVTMDFPPLAKQIQALLLDS